MTTARKKLESSVVKAMRDASTKVMEWGEDDCALFVGNILRDALGYDAAKEFRGRYKTRLGAARAMGRDGVLGVARKMAKRRRWKRINPRFAQPGDVGLAWTTANGKPVLGAVICRKTGWFVGRNENGFTALDTDNVAYAWSVLRDCEPGHRVNLHSAVRHASSPVHEPLSIGVAIGALLDSIAALGPVGQFFFATTLSIGVCVHDSN